MIFFEFEWREVLDNIMASPADFAAIPDWNDYGDGCRHVNIHDGEKIIHITIVPRAEYWPMVG